MSDKEPSPLARYAREVPAELERIVEKALRKDREQRYQTAKDMLLDLRSLKRRQEVEAELERSRPPDTISGQATVSGASRTASGQASPTTPSAESLTSGIKHHRRSLLIACAALIVAAVGLAYLFYFSKPNSAIDSIAVLPFQNKNSDADTEYLSDGLAESLIYRLSQLPNLKVSPTSSVMRYKGKETDAIKIGNELGVNAVLSGRMVQRGDNLTISVELVDVRNNKLLWGEQYERKMSELLATQREIATAITEKLQLKLSGEGEKALNKRYTDNNEAYQLYLKGNYYTAKATKDGLRKGNEYFNQALAKDPNFALAHAGLAYYYIIACEWFLSPNESMPKAREAAKKALAIDETLPNAHASLALVAHWYDWDWATAEREFRRAIELNPNDVRTRAWYSWYLLSMGRTDQALAEAKRAQELDPISAEANTYEGVTLVLAHRYDQAVEQLRKSLDLDPNYWFAHDFLGRAFEQQGKKPEAIAEFQRARQLEGAVAELWAMLGHAYAVSGQRSEAQKALVELKEPAGGVYVPPYMVATVYAGLGDKDQSFAWLDRAYTEHSFYLTWLTIDPVWGDLHSDPRYADLVKRVGLPQ